jgi:CubicO group peptidase (beta-lactamase class C family)
MWEMPHYADSAYAILGRALESVVQMPYEDWVKEHIFKPLGTLLPTQYNTSHATNKQPTQHMRDLRAHNSLMDS